MKKIILSVILCSFSFYSNAQSQDGRLKFSAISINLGSIANSNNYTGSLNDFQKLAPNSELLQSPIVNSNSGGYYYEYDFGAMFNVNAYFDISDKNGEKSKYNTKLRFGITFTDQTFFSQSAFSSESFRVDTLTSSRDGNTFFVDSVQNENYSMSYGSDQLLFDVAYIIGSNTQNRLSIYGGLGVSLGFSFNASTEISFSKDNYFVSGATYASNSNLFNDLDFKEENFANDGGFSAMLSVPFGLEFRLSKRDNAWGKSRLFVEGRPGITYLDIPELESRFITSAIWGFGFKYDF
jgi:hypothetical protein